MPTLQAATASIPISLQQSWQPLLITDEEIPAASIEPSARRAASPVGTDFYIVPGTGGHGRARADALLAVIQTFGCRVAIYGYDSAPGDTFLVMTGTRPALDALGVLLPQVCAGMEAGARAAARAYATRNLDGDARRRSRTASYLREYLRGYGRGVAEQIRVFRAEVFRDEGPALGSIISAGNARTEQRFTREFPASPSLRTERTGPRAARRAGAAAGRTASIDSYLAIHDLVFAML